MQNYIYFIEKEPISKIQTIAYYRKYYKSFYCNTKSDHADAIQGVTIIKI